MDWLKTLLTVHTVYIHMPIVIRMWHHKRFGSNIVELVSDHLPPTSPPTILSGPCPYGQGNDINASIIKCIWPAARCQHWKGMPKDLCMCIGPNTMESLSEGPFFNYIDQIFTNYWPPTYTVAVSSWSIANNFVIDFYCRCLEILCQIAINCKI